MPILFSALSFARVNSLEKLDSKATATFFMIKEKMQNRLNTSQNHSDLLSHLVKARKDLSDAEIEFTADIIIIAESNLLTTTLAGTINYLLRFSEALVKLITEIRSAYATKIDIILINVDHLSYLSAVIETDLRIVAPVPLEMPRVVSETDNTVCEEWLSENINFSI